MSTQPHRARIQQIASLVLAAALLAAMCVLSPAGAAAQPVAHASSSPVAGTSSSRRFATISSSTLRRALAERIAAQRAVRRDTRALRSCRRRRPGRCRRAHRALRGARARLVIAQRRVLRLHARMASTRRPAAASPSAPPETNFGEPFVKGINTNLEGWGTQDTPQIASEMSTLGVNWAREELSWAELEPQPGVFDWSRFDRTVAAAQANGISILPVIGYAPSWSNPTDAAGFATFVKAAVQRYGPGTSANLRWWELWNEPYYSYAWSGKTPEPEAYARDVVAAAEAAKGASPSVKLLVAADYTDDVQAGSSSSETSWIDNMFSAEPALGQWIDGVAVHPYGDDPALPLAKPGAWEDSQKEWAFQRIDMVRAKFLAHGVNVPFWITEAGWSNATVSEATQAAYYSDVIPQVAARPWVRALFPYCLREFDASGGKESEFGLLKYGSWAPKPAFFALQKALSSVS